MINLQSINSGPDKLSHKKWKALIKKEKRRAKRQAEAKKRAEEEAQELKAREHSPSYLRAILEEELAERQKEEEEERKRILLNELWLRREEQAQEWWRLKKQREENERRKREEEEQKIREEWEAREKKQKKEEEEKKKDEGIKKDKQEELLKQATANEKKGEDAWHNPILPVLPEQQRETCPFFAKVGVCRFGERCSRGHPDPEITNTLLFPGMYASFKLEQSQRDEYDTDMGLEFEDREIYEHFKEFYYDVLPEFRDVGRVVQFKVCCNYEPHLRGNVYVQFAKEDDAHSALAKFNGRWYAGRQISCHFVKIDRWKNAICGLFHQKKCPKGKACNFLHVFRNPNDEFRDADRDMSPQRGRYKRQTADLSCRRRSRSRSPRYSRSRSHRKWSRSRSRSPRYHRSRSYRDRSYSRSRSRSPQWDLESVKSSRASRTGEPSSRSHSLYKSKQRHSSESPCYTYDDRNGNNRESHHDGNEAVEKDCKSVQIKKRRKHKEHGSRSPSKHRKKHKKHKKHKTCDKDSPSVKDVDVNHTDSPEFHVTATTVVATVSTAATIAISDSNNGKPHTSSTDAMMHEGASF